MGKCSLAHCTRCDSFRFHTVLEFLARAKIVHHGFDLRLRALQLAIIFQLRDSFGVMLLQNIDLKLLIQFEHAFLFTEILKQICELLLFVLNSIFQLFRIGDIGLQNFDFLEAPFHHIRKHLAAGRIEFFVFRHVG